MRYFFHIGYHGKRYRGWQRQAEVTSVQEVLEQNIGRILKAEVHCIGCGRTDAGVHANQYFFHLDTEKELDARNLFVFNKNLPSDIVVFDIIPVEKWAHAQLSATARTYRYFIHTIKDPFLKDYSSLYPYLDLNVPLMQEAATLLTRYQDFRSFCKTPDKHNSTLCSVTSTKLMIDASGQHLCFEITANRFLRGMIRLIVGNLLDVGQEKLTVAQFERYLSELEEPVIPLTAYPQGLYLSKVTYPFLDIPCQKELPMLLAHFPA